MVRNMMFATMLGVMLGATAVYAQDAEEKLVRFEPSVQVIGLENGGLKVLKPGKTVAEDGISYKAYPYGTVFEVADGVKCRIRFSDLTNAVVRGPAKVTPLSKDLFHKVVLKVDQGDVNLSVDQRAAPEQFTIDTPMGMFTSIQGLVRLHIGDIADGEIDENDFSFRAMSGKAVFVGKHYSMANMTTANAFTSGDTTVSASNGKIFHDTRLTGVSAEVMTSLKAGGENNVDFGLAPGSTIKITRAKDSQTGNWVVSVLTLYADGKAKNYFCYVDGRSSEYATGDLLNEVLPEDEEEGEGEEAEEEEDSVLNADGLDDFGDEEL
jgi:hypothetical protein